MTSPAPDAAVGPAGDDARLLERVARGEGAALRTLYERYGSRVMAVARRVLGAISESEEIVQETFVEAWRRAREYDPRRGSPAAWIFTIARSRAIDRLRKRGSSSRTLDAMVAEPAAPAPPSPLEDVESRIERERIGSALAALPEEQRRSIELAFFEGRTHQEIAELTGTPLGTIKTRVRLGMEKLAVLLGRGRSRA